MQARRTLISRSHSCWCGQESGWEKISAQLPGLHVEDPFCGRRHLQSLNLLCPRCRWPIPSLFPPRAISPNSEKLAPCLAVRTRSTSHSTHHVSHGRESKTRFKRKSSHRCKKQTSVANGPGAPGLPQTSVRDQNVIVICNKQEQLAVVCPPIAPWWVSAGRTSRRAADLGRSGSMAVHSVCGACARWGCGRERPGTGWPATAHYGSLLVPCTRTNSSTTCECRLAV